MTDQEYMLRAIQLAKKGEGWTNPNPMVGELARRLNGKYIAPKSEHVKNRVAEIKEGKFDDLIEQVMQKPIEEMQELYNNREIEK